MNIFTLKPITMILGVFLFMVATIIVSSWGILKQKNQERDLMNMLFQKGADKVKKYLKKNDTISKNEIRKLCDGLTAGQPFSSKKAVVRDIDEFSGKLIDYMLKTNQVEADGKRFRLPKKGKGGKA